MDELIRLQGYLALLPDLPPLEDDKIQKVAKWPNVAETIYKSILTELDEGKFLKLLESPLNNTQV